MSRRPLRSALLALALLVVAGCGESGREVRVGRRAPELRKEDLAGRSVALSDLRGRVVLIDFWATWCAPCHLQQKILAPLYQEYRERGAEFLAVSLGEDAATVREFVERQPFAYPVLLDPTDELTARLGIQALPTLMIIDRAGRVAYFEPGVADQETLRRVFAEAGV